MSGMSTFKTSSHLFMTPRINSAPQTKSFYTKGDGGVIPPNDDIYTVKVSGGYFQLQRNTFKDHLAELKKYSNTYINDLDPERTEIFKSVGESLRVLYGYPVYDVIMKDVTDYFADVKDVKPGTVASFFVGCSNNTGFPYGIGCNPKCVSSLPPSNNNPELYTCNDSVLIYRNNTLSFLNNKNSSHAYIYVDYPNPTGFTPDNIKQLQSYGITTVTLIYGNVDGTYRQVSPTPLPLNSLPICLSQDGSSIQNSQTTSTSYAGIFWFLVFIIIIILIFVYFYYRNNY